MKRRDTVPSLTPTTFQKISAGPSKGMAFRLGMPPLTFEPGIFLPKAGDVPISDWVPDDAGIDVLAMRINHRSDVRTKRKVLRV